MTREWLKRQSHNTRITQKRAMHGTILVARCGIAERSGQRVASVLLRADKVIE